MDLSAFDDARLKKIAKESKKRDPELAVRSCIELYNRDKQFKWLQMGYEIKPITEISILYGRSCAIRYDKDKRKGHLYDTAIQIFSKLIGDGCTEVFRDYGCLLLDTGILGSIPRNEEEIERQIKSAIHYCSLALESSPDDYETRFKMYLGMWIHSIDADDKPWIFRAFNANLQGRPAFDRYIRRFRGSDPDYLRPWNHFQYPTKTLFSLFPKYKRLEIRTWLMVARRLGLFRDVKMLIISKIAERDEKDYSYQCMAHGCQVLLVSAHQCCHLHAEFERRCRKCAFDHYYPPDLEPGKPITDCPYERGEEYQTKVLVTEKANLLTEWGIDLNGLTGN